MKFRVAGVIAIIFVALLSPLTAYAEVKEQGLYVEPSRWELTVESGKVTDASFIVANFTKAPLTVNLSVKQFTATDYTYDYKFSDPKDDWITFETPQLELKAGEKRKVQLDINVPRAGMPGGHYFALNATADMSQDGIAQKANVVSTLYLLVKGELTYSGVIENGRAPFLVMESEIVYKFDARNTGNLHYSADLFGKLEGFFVDSTTKGTSHLLMPNAARTIGGVVPAPMLPGLYKLTYGYNTEHGPVAFNSTYILYMPPWSVLAGLLLMYIGTKFLRKKFSKKR